MTATDMDVLAEFRPTWKLRRYMLITLVPLGLTLFLITVSTFFPLGLYLLGGICSLISVICLGVTSIVWLNDFRTVISIYPDKIIKKNYFKENTVQLNHNTQFYHKAVRHYINHIYTGSRDYITVDDGQSQMKFDSNIKNIKGLGELLIKIELQHHMPIVMVKIKQRQSLAFGDLRISATGLECKGKMIQLDKDSEFSIEKGELIIKKVGQRQDFFKIPISNIPNMNTFFKTFDVFRQERLEQSFNQS